MKYINDSVRIRFSMNDNVVIFSRCSMRNGEMQSMMFAHHVDNNWYDKLVGLYGKPYYSGNGIYLFNGGSKWLHW